MRCSRRDRLRTVSGRESVGVAFLAVEQPAAQPGLGQSLLAGLNLLPAYPLDGGRVLRAFFARSIDPAAATRRAVSISHALAMILMVAGLFSNTWLTMVGVIIFSAAQLEERAVIFQSVLDNVRLEEVMLTDFATLSPGGHARRRAG